MTSLSYQSAVGIALLKKLALLSSCYVFWCFFVIYYFIRFPNFHLPPPLHNDLTSFSSIWKVTLISFSTVIRDLINLFQNGALPKFENEETLGTRLASNKINFLSAYCGNCVPQEVTQDSLHKTQRRRITSSITQDGVRMLPV